MKLLPALALAFALLAMAGCGDGAESTTPPKPSPTYATESQVASVIAGVQESLRATADEAEDCRLSYVVNDRDNPQQRADVMTCYANEVAAGMDAQTAAAELSSLDIPPSMTDLVTETVTALEGVAGTELESSCGESFTDGAPTRNDKCSDVLGSRLTAYGPLTDTMSKWTPYL